MADDRADRPVLVELSQLISAGYTDPTEYWDVGEPVLAIEVLADNLAEYHMPVGDTDRERLRNLARQWPGLCDRVARCLRWCPNPDRTEPPWTVVEGTDLGRDIGVRLAADIGPDHLLHGRQVIAWLVCNGCDDVLVRVYDDRIRTKPYMFAVIRPAHSWH